MRLFVKYLLLFFCSIITIFSMNGQSIDDLNFMTEDYPPYNYKEDGKLKGIFVDTLVLMLKELGSSKGRKDIVLYPWARGYYNLQTDKNAVLFATIKNKKRENLFKWVGPLTYGGYILIAPKSKKIKIKGVKDLLKYRIGTIRGDAMEEVLVSKGYPRAQLKPVSKAFMNVKKLQHNRIDLWASGFSGLWKLKKMGLKPKDYEIVYVVSKGLGNYYAFNKKVSDLIINEFREVLKKIKKEGKLQQIIDSYVNQ